MPEGRKTDVDDDVEGAVVSGLEALDGIVVCMTLGGRLTVVDGCVVSWGGRVFELDTASACVVGTADEDASVPMIVKGALMSPEEPNTAGAEGAEGWVSFCVILRQDLREGR